jgi:hypothetical protein
MRSVAASVGPSLCCGCQAISGNGVHTSVVTRKLVTGSKFDVQFDNLDGRYLFGFAAFDNAQVQHATGDEPLALVFAK